MRCELGLDASSLGENSGLGVPATAVLLVFLAPRPLPLLRGSLGDMRGRAPLLEPSPATKTSSPTSFEADLVTLTDCTKCAHPLGVLRATLFSLKVLGFLAPRAQALASALQVR